MVLYPKTGETSLPILLLPLLLSVACGLAGVSATTAEAQSETGQAPPATCPDNFARVDVTVGGEPSEPLGLSPPVVWVYMPDVKPKATWIKRQVCWVVHGLEQGYTLHIRPKEGQENPFPKLERTVSPPRSTAMSGVPDAAGSWKYSLFVTDPEGNEIHYTDPEVIIKDEW